MANVLGSRSKFIYAGADDACATLASNRNPDGSIFAMNVSLATMAGDVGFSVTAAAGGIALPSTTCRKVTLQNRLTADDGTTAQTQSVWVVIGGVKVFELVNGVSVDVYTDNAANITVTSFAGTSLVSGTITP